MKAGATRLRIGRLPVGKGPKLLPCQEPLVYNSNVLPSGGAEGHVAQTGSTAIPMFYDYNDGFHFFPQSFKWMGATPGAYTPGPPVSYFAQSEVDLSNGDNAWEVSTTDPYAGTYHFKTITESGGGVTNAFLHMLVIPKCGYVLSPTPYDPPWITARLVAGDAVTVGFMAKITAGAGSAGMSLHIYFLGSNGEYQGGAFNETSNFASQALTGTYASFSDSFVAPSGSYYLMVALSVNALAGAPAGTARNAYVDQLSVVIV